MALNPEQRSWRGKVVWLVGASSGIGRATASELHALGAIVIVSARNEGALADFANAHPGAVVRALDVTDPGQVKRVATNIIEQYRLNMMVYCAGHYHEMSAQSFDLADLNRHWLVNYGGLLNVLDSVVPHFLKKSQSHSQNQGRTSPADLHISMIGSVAGYSGLPKSLAYGPTKAAMANLAETLYLDLRPLGIGVSLISPGFVDTPLTAQNDFDMPALMTPAAAAKKILDGWAVGEFEIHFPKRFTLWLKLLRILPYRLAFLATGRLKKA